MAPFSGGAIHQNSSKSRLFNGMKNTAIFERQRVSGMSPQMLILPKSSPNIGQFLGQGHNLQKIIGLITDSMTYLLQFHIIITS